MLESVSGKRRRITVPEVPEPPEGTWSNCFVIGNLVVIAGMVGKDSNNQLVGPGDAYAQTMQAFTRMKLFVEARKQFFSGDFPPCVVVGGTVFAQPEYLVEIEAMAILGSGG